MQPYFLHGIMVHEGPAEHGHYYSFIFDRKRDVWWRFNDHRTTVETEETVMQESLGGQRDSAKTAYMLVYVNEFVAKKSLEINALDHVPSNIKQEAQLYNDQFDQLFANQQSVEIARNILTRYNQRVKEQTQTTANLAQTLSVKLINFPTWLEKSKEIPRLANWVNMNIAVREELKHSDLRELSQQRNRDAVFSELCRLQPQETLMLT